MITFLVKKGKVKIKLIYKLYSIATYFLFYIIEYSYKSYNTVSRIEYTKMKIKR